MAANYYNILGVDRNASPDEIKKAFRKKAQQYHPDKASGDEAKFKEVNEAYTVLKDKKKRAQYDQFGQAGAGGNPFGGGQGGFDFSGFGGADGVEFDLGDLFGGMFGGGGRRQKRGRDISVDIELTFEEAVFGVEKEIHVTKPSVCDVCDGSRATPGTRLTKCVTCDGQGKVRRMQQTPLGQIATASPCADCMTTGEVPEVPCSKCRGSGVAESEKKFTVSVPPGVSTGEMMRMTGNGEAVPGGQTGDLYIRIHVARHKVFVQENENLRMQLTLPLTDILLGATHEIKTLDGTVTMKIPAGTHFSEVLRIKGKGVPSARGRHRGDILVDLNVIIPTKLTKQQRQLLAELQDTGL